MANLMAIKETAEYLRLNYMTVYKLAQKGSIPASKVGGNWRFKKETIDNWLTRQTMSGRGAVLVVDDDVMILDLLKEAISEQGYRVVTTQSGDVAIEEVNKQHFALVFLDLVLPGLSGIDTIKAIKERNGNAVTAIVTGYGDDLISQEAMSLGPLVLLHKPFRHRDIVEVLNMEMKGNAVESR